MKIAIIDHESHTLYIEDVDEKLLESQYNGEEQAYIEDMYSFDGEYSWDFIVDAQYLSDKGEGDFVEIDFSKL